MKSLVTRPHIILSVENSPYPDKVRSPVSHNVAIKALQRLGNGQVHSVEGHCGSPERSILISNPTDEQAQFARHLAHVTGQESHIESDGLSHKMYFNHGPNAGKIVHGRGTQWHEKQPKDFFSKLPSGHMFTHNFDFEKSEKLELLTKMPSVSEEYEDVNWPYHPKDEGVHYKTTIHKPTGLKIHRYAVRSENDPNSQTGTIYAITENGHHEGKPIARLEIKHFNPETNEHDPHFSVGLTDPAYRGKGYGTLLHQIALKDYGKLKSDARLSPGSQKIYEKLAQNPRIKAKLAPTTIHSKQGITIFPQDTQHELQYRKKKLAASENIADNLKKDVGSLKFKNFPKVTTRPDSMIRPVGGEKGFNPEVTSRVVGEEARRRFSSQGADKTFSTHHAKYVKQNIGEATKRLATGPSGGLGGFVVQAEGKKDFGKPYGVVSSQLNSPSNDLKSKINAKRYTRAVYHEAIHYSLGDLAHKYNLSPEHMESLRSHLLSFVHPHDLNSVKNIVHQSYDQSKPKLSEEYLTHVADAARNFDQQTLNEFKNKGEQPDHKRIRQAWQKIRQEAALLTPEKLHNIINQKKQPEESLAASEPENTTLAKAPIDYQDSTRRDTNMGKSEKLEKAEVQINPTHGKQIADAYHQMKHDPNHPEVKAAYDALIHETGEQFKKILGSGFRISKIKPGMPNPYKNSKEMHHDIKNNKHLWYFPTEQGFGSGQEQNDHPMLQQTKFKHGANTLLANDVFRIVHDINGHHLGGESGFGPKGEHQAYLQHKKMYSPVAGKALATETMGQNNWVNFGPHGDANRANPSKTVFAEQKAGLLPDNIINGSWHQ